MKKGRKPSKLFQNIYNDFIERAKNGCKPISFYELSYMYNKDFREIKEVCYKVRTRLQEEGKLSLIRLWKKEKNKRRFCYALKPSSGSKEDQALLRADLFLDAHQIEGRYRRFEERKNCAFSTKALPKRDKKQFLLFSDRK